MYATFEKLKQISETTGLATDELGLRWLMHHSQLRDDDVVILGASRASQIEEPLENLHKGPLDEDVAGELNALWTGELQATGREIVDPTLFRR